MRSSLAAVTTRRERGNVPIPALKRRAKLAPTLRVETYWRLPVVSWSLVTEATGNRQSQIENPETHPLPRGGTDLMPPGLNVRQDTTRALAVEKNYCVLSPGLRVGFEIGGFETGGATAGVALGGAATGVVFGAGATSIVSTFFFFFVGGLSGGAMFAPSRWLITAS